MHISQLSEEHVAKVKDVIKVGDDVEHSTWGEGVIILIEGQGEKAEAVVRFPSVGEKRVLLSWTPLEKVT